MNNVDMYNNNVCMIEWRFCISMWLNVVVNITGVYGFDRLGEHSSKPSISTLHFKRENKGGNL